MAPYQIASFESKVSACDRMQGGRGQKGDEVQIDIKE